MRSPSRIALAASTLLVVLLLAACCEEEEYEVVDDIVVPPIGFRSRDQIGHDSGVRPVDAGYTPSPEVVAVEIGTEEEWTRIPCMQACARARPLGSVTTRCQAPARRSDGKLHLECMSAVRKSCTEYRL